MNEPTPPPPDEAPFGDDADEAISAWLDGELAGFAADHGCSRDEALARLEAWPPAVARRNRFDATRRAVGADVALDDLGRRRLVHTALADIAEPSDRPRRVGWWAAAVAATALVLGFGVVGAVWMTGLDNDASRSADGTAATLTPAHGDLGDLGDVSDPAVLRALLGETDEASSDTSGANKRAGGGADAPDKAPSSLDTTETFGGTAPATPPVPEGAAQRCADQLAGAHDEVFRATGTYQGTPAVVLGLEQDGRTIVLVVPADDCLAVLTSVSR